VYRPEECDKETIDSLKDSANNPPVDKTPTEDKSETTLVATTTHSTENKTPVDVPRSVTKDNVQHQQSNNTTICEHSIGNAHFRNSASSLCSSQESASGSSTAGALPLIVIDEYLDSAPETTGERCESATETGTYDHTAADQVPMNHAGAQRCDVQPETRYADEDEGTKNLLFRSRVGFVFRS
jgi:hypothetical protein